MTPSDLIDEFQYLAVRLYKTFFPIKWEYDYLRCTKGWSALKRADHEQNCLLPFHKFGGFFVGEELEGTKKYF